ncbi:uncharacterized protein EDB91DRAFT_1051581, partial [Suillus paluster]|uniref:uncharacterized protein n=1 Tax=Suillus paluster TaxID=48578 RepID=UPI001B85EB3A
NSDHNLHVSSSSYRVDTRDLVHAFTQIGRVLRVNRMASFMCDPHTRCIVGPDLSLGVFAEADAAITVLNATELMGKTLTVERVYLCQPLLI